MGNGRMPSLSQTEPLFRSGGALYVTFRSMTNTLMGYAPCSTDKQDLAAEFQTGRWEGRRPRLPAT